MRTLCTPGYTLARAPPPHPPAITRDGAPALNAQETSCAPAALPLTQPGTLARAQAIAQTLRRLGEVTILADDPVEAVRAARQRVGSWGVCWAGGLAVPRSLFTVSSLFYLSLSVSVYLCISLRVCCKTIFAAVTSVAE
jgi:hypothetical protein